jgi:CMP-N,N'-diacetyllegionaminic acid synthase
VYKNKRIIGLIPARGGSKGLPGKNIKKLLGRPLLCWTIEKALESETFDRVFVSTDSKEIADVARKASVEIPFLRPDALAQDDSPLSAAVIHMLDKFLETGEDFDYVAVLEATSPLRRSGEIDAAVRTLIDRGAKSLVTVGEVHTEHPMIVKRIVDGIVVPYFPDTKDIYQRQQTDTALFPYGVLYLAQSSVYREEKTFYTSETIPFNIERWQNYEIDDALDFAIAEMIMEKYNSGNQREEA